MVQAKLQRAEVAESRLYKGTSRMALAGYMAQSEYSIVTHSRLRWDCVCPPWYS
jgi:hypothetical protein